MHLTQTNEKNLVFRFRVSRLSCIVFPHYNNKRGMGKNAPLVRFALVFCKTC